MRENDSQERKNEYNKDKGSVLPGRTANKAAESLPVKKEDYRNEKMEMYRLR